MTDTEIIDGLKEIDESEDITVDLYESEFLDRIKKMTKPRVLTPRQKAFAVRMIDKYLGSGCG